MYIYGIKIEIKPFRILIQIMIENCNMENTSRYHPYHNCTCQVYKCRLHDEMAGSMEITFPICLHGVTWALLCRAVLPNTTLLNIPHKVVLTTHTVKYLYMWVSCMFEAKNLWQSWQTSTLIQCLQEKEIAGTPSERGDTPTWKSSGHR